MHGGPGRAGPFDSVDLTGPEFFVHFRHEDPGTRPRCRGDSGVRPWLRCFRCAAMTLQRSRNQSYQGSGAGPKPPADRAGARSRRTRRPAGHGTRQSLPEAQDTPIVPVQSAPFMLTQSPEPLAATAVTPVTSLMPVTLGLSLIHISEPT